MIAQVVPFLSQADMLDLNTYKDLGLAGAVFAIGLLVLGFCVIKGHVKIIACGPNEGGMREFFGITLWKAGSGPHLHIAGIFAFRKVSFAFRQIKAVGEANRFGSIFVFSIGIRVRVRNTKDSIRNRVYAAEDLNRSDAENDEAIEQLTCQLLDITREVLEANTVENYIEAAIKEAWGRIELDELHGTASDRGRSTYGYEVLCTTTMKLVEREQSEISRAIRGSDLDLPVGVIGSVPSIGERTA